MQRKPCPFPIGQSRVEKLLPSKIAAKRAVLAVMWKVKVLSYYKLMLGVNLLRVRQFIWVIPKTLLSSHCTYFFLWV
jgi:hypothetical protein